jgi:hypothetical protein
MADNPLFQKAHWSTALLVFALGFLLLYAFFPHGGRSRLSSNHASAQGSLKAIAAGQEQLKSEVLIDRDGDGEGEYGFLSELAMTRRGRLPDSVSEASPFIPRILGMLDPSGVACKAGYCFQLYLPGLGGPMKEKDGIPNVDPKLTDLHEKNFFLFAWPQRTGITGSRFFVMSAFGEIYFMEPSPFSGMKDAPSWIYPLLHFWLGESGEMLKGIDPPPPWQKLG